MYLLKKRKFRLLVPIFVGIMTGLFLSANFNLITAQEHEELKDQNITLAIESQLKVDEGVNAHLVDVLTIEGVVTLSGSVENLLAKERAARIAESIKGVRSVVNKIIVKPVERSDQEIKEDVEAELMIDPATESWEIETFVLDGVVTLKGEVSSYAEKKLAEEVVMGVKGIKEVKNEISLKPVADRSDLDIRNDIVSRLRSSIWVNDGLIKVNVNDGEVSLSGVVGSSSEKRRAYSLAWVAGVKAVGTDQLEVKWWYRDQARREKKYVVKSDEEIKQAVNDAFLYDPRLYLFNPDIEVENGVVTLTGQVNNLEAKKAAEQDAQNTIGVVRVKNYLKVRPKEILADTDIKKYVNNALDVDPIVDLYQINVTVINGKVYLDGRVETDFEKSRAEKVASGQPGVIEVENNVIVAKEWQSKSDQQIKDDIRDQFFWSLRVNDENININVENGHVILTGQVDTRYEAQAAVENAFEGGARTVFDDLDIKYHYDNFEPGHYFDRPFYDYYRWPYYGPYYHY